MSAPVGIHAPSGAAHISDWADLEHGPDGYRCVTGRRHVDVDTEAKENWVETFAVQSVGGSLDGVSVRADVDLWLDIQSRHYWDNELSPAEARQYAQKLRAFAQRLTGLADGFDAAAELADTWAGQSTPGQISEALVTRGGAAMSSTTNPTTILVEQNDEGTDRLEIVCEPFEQDLPGYAGEKFLAILWDGEEEAFAVLKAEHAAQLAQLLLGGDR